MDLAEMAQAVKGELLGADVKFTGVSTDTRTIQKGDLFVALEGPNFDGHQFLAEAQTKYAAGAMVNRPNVSDLPQVAVNDTRLGLGTLAGYWRNKFTCPVVGVTGSNGKTTVKEMVGSILRIQGDVLVSSGNLNNEIGLPLVLCRIRERHIYAVVEMGMNRRGEIDYLTRLAKPKVAVITNAAMAHLEGLGTVESVAEAKAEIFNGLSDDGIAIVNVDDVYASMWRHLAGQHECITFGLEHPADVTARHIQMHDTRSAMNLSTPQGACEVMLPLPGLHNIMNALAATGAAIGLGIELSQVKEGLQTITPVAGRLHILQGTCGATVIDDTYNANPNSMVAAVQVLAAAEGNKVLVMGDMGELGTDAELLHAQVGKQASQAGINCLMTCGELSESAARAFGPHARHFADKEELIDALKQSLNDRSTVLVKGSRFMRMEQIVHAITESKGRH